jgi:hypothetical protein
MPDDFRNCHVGKTPATPARIKHQSSGILDNGGIAAAYCHK